MKTSKKSGKPNQNIVTKARTNSVMDTKTKAPPTKIPSYPKMQEEDFWKDCVETSETDVRKTSHKQSEDEYLTFNEEKLNTKESETMMKTQHNTISNDFIHQKYQKLLMKLGIEEEDKKNNLIPSLILKHQSKDATYFMKKGKSKMK